MVLVPQLLLFFNNFFAALPDLAKNAIITVADDEADIFYTGNREILCAYYDGILEEDYTLITCDKSISGQYVQMLFNATTILNIYEFEVFGV